MIPSTARSTQDEIKKEKKRILTLPTKPPSSLGEIVIGREFNFCAIKFTLNRLNFNSCLPELIPIAKGNDSFWK